MKWFWDISWTTKFKSSGRILLAQSHWHVLIIRTRRLIILLDGWQFLHITYYIIYLFIHNNNNSIYLYHADQLLSKCQSRERTREVGLIVQSRHTHQALQSIDLYSEYKSMEQSSLWLSSWTTSRHAILFHASTPFYVKPMHQFTSCRHTTPPHDDTPFHLKQTHHNTSHQHTLYVK